MGVEAARVGEEDVVVGEVGLGEAEAREVGEDEISGGGAAGEEDVADG